MTTPPTPAGWYPDPERAGDLRYWDGALWTEHRSPAQESACACGTGTSPSAGRAGRRR